MTTLSNSERLNLKKLISESDSENNTEHIRKVKHSVFIRDDIRKMNNLKKNNETMNDSEPEKFRELCESECVFLFNNYTDIFNKLLKDEIDLRIMTKLLMVLKMIEDNQVDQHEGSVMVGKILKELYIDSAQKRADNIDKEYEDQKPTYRESKKISWSEYKKMKENDINV
jgi:hypothetical protein